MAAQLKKGMRTMPTIIITGPEIKDPEKKRTAYKEIVASVMKAYRVRQDEVGIFLHELPDTNIAPGGIMIADMTAERSIG
jgi:phenylpyruvate tautomerase PptA (4-oxalocrotonate tautomerase family)